MPSIRQNAYPDVLPDFRNLAVIARVLLAVNVLALAGALYASPSVMAALERFVYIAAFLEPLLLIGVGAPFPGAAVADRVGRPFRARRRARAAAVLGRLRGRADERRAARRRLPRRRRRGRSGPGAPQPGPHARAGAVRRRLFTGLLPSAHEGVLARAGGGAAAGAAGAHPAAFSVQQPERRAGAHPVRSKARRALAGGPGRFVSHADGGRAPVRAPGRRDLAPRALRRDRAAAPRRPVAHQLGARCLTL